MSFTIFSSVSENAIEFSNLEPEYFTAKIIGNVAAVVRVCTYTDERGLLNFLNKLAKFNKPWKDKLTWFSLEEQFLISATCSSLGEVVFQITLSDMHGHPEQWQAKTGFVTNFGQLQLLAKQAERFFKNAGT